MSKQLAILHLTLSFATGGRRTAIETLTAASKQDCQHFLAVLNQFDTENTNINTYFIDSLELNRQRGIDLKALARLKLFCQQHAISIIHAHDAASQMTAAILRLRLPKIKLIMTFHRSLAMESASLKDKLRNALSCLLSEKVICASSERQKHFISENFISANKVITIPLGVNIDTFFPSADIRTRQRANLNISDSTFVFGVVGHFGEEKGVDQAISSFNRFCKDNQGLNVVLLVIGQGNSQRTDHLHQLAEQFNTRIQFLGFRHDVAVLMQAMDCFLHTPRIEAFGLVLIEAMSSGLPVIATNVGGIPDIVINESTGWLCDNGDLNGLIRALKSLSINQQLAKDMGHAGRKRALLEYKDSIYAERNVQLYKSIINAKNL